jgi:cbb3-type cytochrome oxidase maturation protein
MIVGLAMGVTIVMLPVGLSVGIVGLLVFLWGLVGRSGEA